MTSFVFLYFIACVLGAQSFPSSSLPPLCPQYCLLFSLHVKNEGSSLVSCPQELPPPNQSLASSQNVHMAESKSEHALCGSAGFLLMYYKFQMCQHSLRALLVLVVLAFFNPSWNFLCSPNSSNIHFLLLS